MKLEKLAAKNSSLKISNAQYEADNNRLSSQLFFTNQMQEHLQQQLQQREQQQIALLSSMAEGKIAEETGDIDKEQELDVLLSQVGADGNTLPLSGGEPSSPVLHVEEENVNNERQQTPPLNMDSDDSPILVAEEN